MKFLLLLVLMGLIMFYIVRRVADVTRTPTWLLWTVAMTPAFIWSIWALVQGDDKPMPAALVLLPLIICLALYWFLIQLGRLPQSSSEDSPGRDRATPPAPRPEPSRVPATPTTRPIDKNEEAQLQTCFPWSVYYLQEVEYRPQAVICRGQLRSKPEVAYRTVNENVTTHFGDRFYVVFQEGYNGKPFFALVSNPQAGRSGKSAKDSPRWALALLLLAITLVTTTVGWLQLQGETVRALSWPSLAQGLPYGVGLMTILGVHEAAHYLMAHRYRIRTTLPYFIPVLPMPIFPFGTFGAFMQLRSPMPHRRALFDVGLAGPLAGFVVALPMLLWGLAQSQPVPLPEEPNIFNFRAFDPGFSLLVSLASKVALGDALTPETAIALSPLGVAGLLGLVVTALNLMPVGQLDGGHIVHAMFGQRQGATISQVARVLLLLLAVTQIHLILWAVVLFLMPAADEPALNDVTELDNGRDFWGLLSLALLLLIILPTPPFLAQWLNL